MCSCNGNCNCNSTTIPKGPTGPQGPAGGIGPAGPPNELTIGTVDTGSAAATITGTSPNQVLNLTIPQGLLGPTGLNGTTRLYDFVGSSNGIDISPNWQNLNSYTLPADKLSNDGDSIVISALHLQNNNPVIIFGILFYPYRRITFDSNNLTFNNGNDLYDLTSSIFTGGGTFTYLFRTTVELIRTGVDTATCKVLADIGLSKTNLQTISCSTTISSGLDFTANNVIEFDVLQNTANQSVLKVLTIDLIKKV
jgi:hypothetical protein